MLSLKLGQLVHKELLFQLLHGKLASSLASEMTEANLRWSQQGVDRLKWR